MKIYKSLRPIFAGAVLLGVSGLLVVIGIENNAASQGVQIDERTRVMPLSTEGRVLNEVLSECSTVKDYENRRAVTTCKIEFK